MITPKDIMSDEEVARLVNLSTDRFQRRMRDGFKSGEYDFRRANPTVMGGRRVHCDRRHRVRILHRLLRPIATILCRAPVRNDQGSLLDIRGTTRPSNS